MAPNRHKWIIGLTTIALIGLFYTAFLKATVLSYSGAPFQATVVDKDTAKPIDGVIVAAVWHLETRGGRGAGFLNVTEAITEANGSFQMSGWGPLEVKRTLESGMLPPRLAPEQPWLILFKPGYRIGTVEGEGTTTSYLNDRHWTGEPVRMSYWNGKTIKLERFVGDDLAYQRELSNSKWPPRGDCLWTKTPRMTAALIKETERLNRTTGQHESPTLSSIRETDAGKYCGSPTAILGPLLK